jgi:hypothetical protein
MPRSRAALRFSSLSAALLGMFSCDEGGGGLSEPTTGMVEVTVTTTGAEGDPDGYTLQVDGDPLQPIGSTGTWQSGNLADGLTLAPSTSPRVRPPASPSQLPARQPRAASE